MSPLAAAIYNALEGAPLFDNMRAISERLLRDKLYTRIRRQVRLDLLRQTRNRFFR